MSLLRSLRRRPRLLDEAWFALGGAVAGAVAGLIVEMLALPPPLEPAPGTPRGMTWVLAVAPGLGIGWWAGLLWSALLAVAARRSRPVPPVKALLPAAVLAAVVTVICSAAARLAGLPVSWGILGGVVAGTLAARFRVARPTP
jgi:uncharacterized membrane protein